jgi:hypothetical protein
MVHEMAKPSGPKRKRGKMICLNDIITLRMAELSRLLAGCVIVYPAQLIRFVKKIDKQHFTDARVRFFFALLEERQQDFEELEPGRALAVVAELAFEEGYSIDYLSWLSMATLELTPGADLADLVVREIQRLAIARKVVRDLQDYVTQTILVYGTGNLATRKRRANLSR